MFALKLFYDYSAELICLVFHPILFAFSAISIVLA